MEMKKMRKGTSFFVFCLFLLSIFSFAAIAKDTAERQETGKDEQDIEQANESDSEESGEDSEQDEPKLISAREEDNDIEDESENRTIGPVNSQGQGIKNVLRIQQKATERECKNYTKSCEDGEAKSCAKIEIDCKETEVEENSSLEIKDKKLFLNNKEVKVMPDTASARAIEVLSLKGLNVTLKDTGKPTYEIKGKKETKILGLFKKQMEVTAEVDAETGELQNVKRPWWSFLAKEE
jgi:hypothetical protein